MINARTALFSSSPHKAELKCEGALFGQPEMALFANCLPICLCDSFSLGTQVMPCTIGRKPVLS